MVSTGGMRLCSILILVLLSRAAPAVAATYYFSPSGSDAAAGTSPSTAFQHLNRTLSLQLAAGDEILLQRGGVWLDESLTIAFANGLYIGAYGDAATARPAIVHSLPAGNLPTCCVQIFNGLNLVIDGLHVAGCFNGISLRYTQANSSNVEIANCLFRDVRQPDASYQPSGGNWARAISFEGGSVSNVSIHNNVAIRVDTFFNSGTFIDGLDMNANTMAQCGYNCVGLGGTNMTFRNSVFLRDTPPRIFLYGTTDIIVGTVSGANSISNTDFVMRGEYEAGPDGCALDFETAATGFRVTGNTFYRSWGAGIMIFGHDTTSQGLTIDDNAFISAGCTQPRDDRGGIGFMCPGGHLPSGVVANNSLMTCPNSEAFHQAFPGCSDNITFVNNTINDGLQAVALPEISFNPPAPSSTAPTVKVPMLATCLTPNATLRYTLDGSRPTETSPIVPPEGIALLWPGPNVAFNVRGFYPGMIPSPTQGVIVERRLYKPRVGSGGLGSSLDTLSINKSSAAVGGWAVDYGLSGGGVPPVTVQLRVDFETLATVVASQPRPDLVPSKVAPNADHGFTIPMDAATVSRLQTGRHLVQVFVVGSPSCPGACELNNSPVCVTDGAVASCD